MCPFSRASQGAPSSGISSSQYSVKVKRCAELCVPRLRSTTSVTIATIIATMSAPATTAMPRSTAS